MLAASDSVPAATPVRYSPRLNNHPESSPSTHTNSDMPFAVTGVRRRPMLIGSDIRRLNRATFASVCLYVAPLSVRSASSTQDGEAIRIASCARPRETSSPEGEGSLRRTRSTSASATRTGSRASSRLVRIAPEVGNEGPADTSTIDGQAAGSSRALISSSVETTVPGPMAVTQSAPGNEASSRTQCSRARTRVTRRRARAGRPATSRKRVRRSGCTRSERGPDERSATGSPAMRAIGETSTRGSSAM